MPAELHYLAERDLTVKRGHPVEVYARFVAGGTMLVDREALRRAVLGDDAALNRLERIVHPLVRDAEQRFLGAARRRAEPLVVLDIPLLFETHGHGRCDAVLVVTAPAAVQREVVGARTSENVPAIPAAAPMIATGLPAKGWSGGREAQSIAFFSTPGIE